MRMIITAVALVFTVAPALAHPSVVPHQHPHAASVLPDAFALLLAAVLVGLGFIALRRTGKEKP